MSAATVTPIDPDQGRDPKVEAWLDEHHVIWKFHSALPLDQIDQAKSLANQARIGEPLIAETVETYTAAYKRGDLFPPLIARRTSPRAKKMVLIGGNHRYQSASAAGQHTHPVYEIECADETAVVLTYSDNARHGQPPSRLERLAQAAHLVEQGHTGKDAAAIVGIHEANLSNYRTALKAGMRARQLGAAQAWDAIGVLSTQTLLAQIELDGPFMEAVRLVAIHQLSGPNTKDLVRRLKAAGSEAKMLQLIGTEDEERRHALQSRAGRAAAVTTDYGRCKTAVTTLIGLDPINVAASAPNQETRDRLRKQLRELGPHVAAILKALTA